MCKQKRGIGVLLLLHFTSLFAIEYQNAQAPPPSAASSCQGWCPKWTCCKLCDDPQCSGCGAKRQCAGQPTSSTAAANGASGAASVASGDGTAAASAVNENISPPGFQTGSNGYLMSGGRRFTVKGINWWGMEGPSRTFGGLKLRSMDGLLDFIQEQGFNSIRVLLNHRGIMINGKIPAGEFDEGRTPELVNLRYLDQLELMVRWRAFDRVLCAPDARHSSWLQLTRSRSA